MKKLLISGMLLLLAFKVSAQEPEDELPVIDRIKPLKELIQLALENAPGLEMLGVSQSQTQEEIAITKKKWLQHFALTAGVNYGNGIVSDQLNDGSANNRITYLTRQNVTYNLGFNIRLPLSEASSRKNEIKLKRLEIKRLEYLKEDRAQVIRHEVIKRYNELTFSFKAAALQTEVAEANAIALEVAENYFKAGKLAMEQYRMAVDANYTAKLELEKSKSEIWLRFKTLSDLVGTSILK